MRASVGQSAAWAALAGHIGACFQPRCLRTARHPRASGTAESLQRGRGSRLSHRRSAAAATGQATGPVTAQFSTLNEMPPVTQLMSSHGRSGPCFESHLPAPYFLLSTLQHLHSARPLPYMRTLYWDLNEVRSVGVIRTPKRQNLLHHARRVDRWWRRRSSDQGIKGARTFTPHMARHGADRDREASGGVQSLEFIRAYTRHDRL